jgi:predicted alpha/beta superfamily hydrolase
MVDVIPLPPVSIPNSEVRTLSSKSVGQEYNILVSLPSYPNYAESNERYPVLYVLDPNMLFGWIAALVRESALLSAVGYPTAGFVPPNLIVVGIGYPMTLYRQPKLAFSLRTRDQTPTNVPDMDKVWGGPSGGAKNFLRFIRDELMPCINSNYRTDPTDSTIVGHSFGGLFALYVLFHEPDAFRRYVASSPSLWWDKKVTFEYEREYASKHTELSARLFLSAGATEELEYEEAHMTSNLKEFAEILRQRNYVGLDWKSHIFEDEGHLSVEGAAVCKGISSVFSKSETKPT